MSVHHGHTQRRLRFHVRDALVVVQELQLTDTIPNGEVAHPLRLPVLAANDFHLALDDNVEVLARLAVGDQGLAGLELLRLESVCELEELLLLQPFEEADARQEALVLGALLFRRLCENELVRGAHQRVDNAGADARRSVVVRAAVEEHDVGEALAGLDAPYLCVVFRSQRDLSRVQDVERVAVLIALVVNGVPVAAVRVLHLVDGDKQLEVLEMGEEVVLFQNAHQLQTHGLVFRDDLRLEVADLVLREDLRGHRGAAPGGALEHRALHLVGTRHHLDLVRNVHGLRRGRIATATEGGERAETAVGRCIRGGGGGVVDAKSEARNELRVAFFVVPRCMCGGGWGRGGGFLLFGCHRLSEFRP
eukprot:PhM_4_TR17286/c0_g1_i1/m.9514